MFSEGAFRAGCLLERPRLVTTGVELECNGHVEPVTQKQGRNDETDDAACFHECLSGLRGTFQTTVDDHSTARAKLPPLLMAHENSRLACLLRESLQYKSFEEKVKWWNQLH